MSEASRVPSVDDPEKQGYDSFWAKYVEAYDSGLVGEVETLKVLEMLPLWEPVKDWRGKEKYKQVHPSVIPSYLASYFNDLIEYLRRVELAKSK